MDAGEFGRGVVQFGAPLRHVGTPRTGGHKLSRESGGATSLV
jgi:hypothetical protein